MTFCRLLHHRYVAAALLIFISATETVYKITFFVTILIIQSPSAVKQMTGLSYFFILILFTDSETETSDQARVFQKYCQIENGNSF